MKGRERERKGERERERERERMSLFVSRCERGRFRRRVPPSMDFI
jgi:hypothetical protein